MRLHRCAEIGCHELIKLGFALILKKWTIFIQSVK
mgnify:CR=1 FL=1